MYMNTSSMPFVVETTTDIFKIKNNIADGSIIFAMDTKKTYIKIDGTISPIDGGPEIKNKRSKIKSNCVNCGAPLKISDLYSTIVKCEYCGTCQDIDDNIDL